MFDFLPATDADALAGAPLVQVVAELKFNAQASLSTHAGVGLLHDALADEYPRLLAEQQAVITATPGGVTTAQVPQWRLTDIAGQWAVVVGPEQLALETAAYGTWALMRGRLQRALNALHALSTPRVRERVGLRYVNHIPATADGSFGDRVRPELLGMATVDGWRQVTAAAVSQTVLRDEPVQMVLRYGSGATVVPGNAFVLDIDCSDEHPVEYAPEAVVSYFDELNDAAYRCFCFCVPEAFRASLQD